MSSLSMKKILHLKTNGMGACSDKNDEALIEYTHSAVDTVVMPKYIRKNLSFFDGN